MNVKRLAVYIAEWAGWLNIVDHKILRAYVSAASVMAPEAMPNTVRTLRTYCNTILNNVHLRFNHALSNFYAYFVICTTFFVLVVLSIVLVKGITWFTNITLSPVQYFVLGIGLVVAVAVVTTYRSPYEKTRAEGILKLLGGMSLLSLLFVVSISIPMGITKFFNVTISPIQYVPLVVMSMAVVIFSISLLERPEKKRRGCFPADALIDTPTGMVRIAAMSPGAVIWAWDITAEKRTVSRVTARKTYYESTIVDIITNSNVSALSTTSNHTFFTQRGWVKCSKLKVTDSLLRVSETGTRRFEEIVSIHKTLRQETVYNLHTTGKHNFICNGFVAHNFTICRRIRTLFHRILIDPRFIVTSLERGKGVDTLLAR